MMLTGENRLITDIGMRKLAMTSNVGLRALMRHCTADGREKRGISTSTVSFMLAPRINAAGRLGKAELAARLFLTGDANEADMLAEKLCEMNRERQAMENDIYEEAVAELEESFDTKRDKVIVLWHEDWHHGVIGIVASRLADKYFVPSILISLDEDEGKGSGRSIQGFNLFEALSQCGSLLTKYGGHELAAGLTVPKSNLLELRKALSEYTREFISDDCVPIIEADCEVDPALLTLEAVEELSKLEPYGMGNPQPVLVIKEAKILSMIPIGNDRHTRLTLECQGLTYDSVLFGVCSDDLPMVEDDIVDIIFTPDINNFRGKSVQLILKDIQRCESDLRQDERDDELYDRFTRNENLTSAEAARIRPVRKELVAVWRGVNRHASEGMLKTDITKLQGKLRQESGTELNRAKLLIALDVFSELGLFVHEVTDNILIVYTRKVSRKADISTSMILRRLKAFE
jgi:single-stranded-DNA-specific exonuclease